MTHTVIIQGRFVPADLDHDHFCLDNLSRGPPSGSLSVVRQHLTFPSAGALPVLPMLAKYWMTFFVFSVLPAPDSPLQGKENMHRDHQAEENLEAVNCTVILIMDLGCNPRLNTTMAKKPNAFPPDSCLPLLTTSPIAPLPLRRDTQSRSLDQDPLFRMMSV